LSGAFFAVLLITILAPLVARFAPKFGAAEMFAVQMLTFCSIVGMSKEPPAKTLAIMALGFALAAVGMDTVTGTLRVTYGVTELLKGFDFLIAVIGLIGIGEILLTMEEGLAFKGKSAKIQLDVVLKTRAELLFYWKTSIRSVLVGCWMGVTPGSFMACGLARCGAKDKDSFGKGNIEGVVAPETAARAAGTSALLPMLTLGIPGSPTAAALLGGLLIWGLQPGPLLFAEKPDFVSGMIASIHLGNIVGLIIVLTTVPWWAAILRIPFSVIGPIIIVICAIGACTMHSSIFDVVMMLVFGYLFKKLRYPLASMVLALALGDMAESGFRHSMLLSQGSLDIFRGNPLVGGLMMMSFVMLLWPIVPALKHYLRSRA
jgi:putative tricarboxylic transport membrane protein